MSRVTGKAALAVPGALSRLSEVERLAVAAEVAAELGAAFEPAPTLFGMEGMPGVVWVAADLTFVLMPAGVFEMGLTEADLLAWQDALTNDVIDELAESEELEDLDFIDGLIRRLGVWSKPARQVAVAPFALGLRSLSVDHIEALSGVRPRSTSFANPAEVRALLAPHGLRLLSEAEWEYVARDGNATTFQADAVARYLCEPLPDDREWGVTHFGVQHLSGEWVDDPWHDDFVGAPETAVVFRRPDDMADGPGVCRGNPCAGQCLSQAASQFVAFRAKSTELDMQQRGTNRRSARPAFGPDASGRWRLPVPG